MMPKDRRVCLVIVPERFLVNLFQGPGQCIAVRLNHPKLPPDAEVLGVRHDWDRQALSALVHSESFQKVTDGAPLPYFDCGATVADYTLRYIDGDRITERRPLNQAAAQKWRDAEIEAAQSATVQQFRLTGARETETQSCQYRDAELVKAGDVIQTCMGAGRAIPDIQLHVSPELKARIESCDEIRDLTDEERACNERSKAEQFRALAGSKPETPPAGESSREWFQRFMSQTD